METRTPKFKKNLPSIAFWRDKRFLAWIILVVIFSCIGLAAFALIIYAKYGMPESTDPNYPQVVSYSLLGVMIGSFTLVAVFVALAYFQIGKQKKLAFDQGDDIMYDLFKIDNLHYVGQEFKKPLAWVRDTVRISPLSNTQEVKFTYDQIFINKDINKIDLWKSEAVVVENLKNQEQKTFLFLEGDIKSKKFKQDYILGEKFPVNFRFNFKDDLEDRLHKPYRLLTQTDTIDEEAYKQIVETMQALDLWNRGYGFFIDSAKKKVYSWVQTDFRLFRLANNEQIDIASASEKLVRDLYLLETLQTLPLLLD
ncbi:hypothetical protein [Mycoplasmopsis columbinasalis]|nr:hypothetical protein [Mycoplasmopsis columbinasalis]